MKRSRADGKAAAARERLRRSYRPRRVKLLFVGESPPASGRFFYRADSGLYRAMQKTFVDVFPALAHSDFLEAFREMDCYLVDLCGEPVDRMDAASRRRACGDGEVRLSAIIRRLRPKVIVTMVRSIAENVRRAEVRAKWQGERAELPYPGRWQRHRVEFAKSLAPILIRELKLPKSFENQRSSC